ncbi:succinyl-CoA:3-ketoacid-coenzyme A transferase 1, mitochondrial precursor [Histoplasma mississippiense (nom. inval.)]|uniref:succinyl-CoA:3-ketoacid-coenzyme A transferase 1, mitochondrial precursor n=1 Tax=Ajellomyces capsulatus (strain NAm1 / WU24) TaxID=2059318 RepID=UPI000157C670|nr:succinyl-CoA:3-ketoacid-coenzyme A transferase 1, mitochondrial precursor [Histoplasma mississippiense (nom. inval.)]EDN08812.1 succinyl-CoA:3-ketoacid-coenzyme A transferase 1, mitochondrial precursor [Histoplasma mississippiense (nom. inval.)]
MSFYLRVARGFSNPLKHQRFLVRAFSSTLRRNEINKVLPSAAEAIKDMKSNSTLLAGGFGLCGVPDTLIDAVHANKSITGLTAAADRSRRWSPATSEKTRLSSACISAAKLNLEIDASGKLWLNAVVPVVLGIPAFYTPAAFGTVVQTGNLPLKHNADGTVAAYGAPRDVKVFDGKSYVMEEAIKGDYAFVKAWKADRLGNCQFRFAAANFNGAMGRNAKMTIVEAEHIVEVGEIDPAAVHLPGIYVKRVVQSTKEKKIEKYTFAKEDGEGADLSALGKGDVASKRERIVRRAAKEFKNGMYANLGIGMPMLAPSFVDPSVEVQLQSENGILGLGPYPKRGMEDPDLINAGKETVTLLPGASCFGSDESFGMIRSGRVNLTILGAMQGCFPARLRASAVPWTSSPIPLPPKVVVTMEHTDKKGNPKILKQCEFPLTGRACVSRIITELCVFDVDFTDGLTLVELADGVTVDEVKAKTEAPFKVADVVQPML